MIAAPHPNKIANYTSYIAGKARGGVAHNQTTLQDIQDFANSIFFHGEEQTDENVDEPICLRYEFDTDRPEPYFFIMLSTRGLMTRIDMKSPIEIDETFKLMLEGNPCTILGQSDADRVFHIMCICVSTNSTSEVGDTIFDTLQHLVADFDPKAYLGDAAIAFRNSFIKIFGAEKTLLMCYAHVYKVRFIYVYIPELLCKYTNSNVYIQTIIFIPKL